MLAANRDGVWNEEGASLGIVVLPPFYRIWWFWLLAVCAAVFAQDMDGTRINFKRGATSATLKGTISKGAPDFYLVGAKAGQTMTVSLTGDNPQLSFSLIMPDEETAEDGFGVEEWTGELPQTGEYSIVVVMNDEEASAAVPFTLEVEIK